jgi:hypothetical protein
MCLGERQVFGEDSGLLRDTSRSSSPCQISTGTRILSSCTPQGLASSTLSCAGPRAPCRKASVITRRSSCSHSRAVQRDESNTQALGGLAERRSGHLQAATWAAVQVQHWGPVGVADLRVPDVRAVGQCEVKIRSHHPQAPQLDDLGCFGTLCRRPELLAFDV